MISFRKKYLVQDLMSEAVSYLKKQNVKFNTITEDEADTVSKVNSKAMVLRSFMKTENGNYQIKIQDKELYNYTQKLIGEFCKMRITNVDKKSRILTAECDHLGVALDIIELLGIKYNLSIVQ